MYPQELSSLGAGDKVIWSQIRKEEGKAISRELASHRTEKQHPMRAAAQDRLEPEDPLFFRAHREVESPRGMIVEMVTHLPQHQAQAALPAPSVIPDPRGKFNLLFLMSVLPPRAQMKDSHALKVHRQQHVQKPWSPMHSREMSPLPAGRHRLGTKPL